MTQGERFHSIDVLKGVMVLLILFAHALFLPDILPVFSDKIYPPAAAALSEWAVTGFIFMFGMTVPFIITKKINNGLSSYEISRAIFSKFLVLLTIGVLMVNTHRVSSEFTSFNSYTWSAVMFCAIFLVWVRYPDEDARFFTVTGLRFLGLALLVFLVFKFRSGTFENGGSLTVGWWEIPGLTGWGFIVSSFTYLAFRNSIPGSTVIWLAFLGLTVTSDMGLTSFLDPVKPYIGPLADGRFPFIMLSGHLASLILKKYSESEFSKTAKGLSIYGLILLISGLVLKQTGQSTNGFFNPAILLMVNGILVLVFLLLHWLVDIRSSGRWLYLLKPAGENYLTAYLFPFIVCYLLLLCRVPLFFFRQYNDPLINIAASGLLAVLMMVSSLIIIKMNIRLKI